MKDTLSKEQDEEIAKKARSFNEGIKIAQKYLKKEILSKHETQQKVRY